MSKSPHVRQLLCLEKQNRDISENYQHGFETNAMLIVFEIIYLNTLTHTNKPVVKSLTELGSFSQTPI
jgi:hypothetical protein